MGSSNQPPQRSDVEYSVTMLRQTLPFSIAAPDNIVTAATRDVELASRNRNIHVDVSYHQRTRPSVNTN